MLQSEERQYKDKIRSLKEQADLASTIALHAVTRIVNESSDLTTEQKDNLLKSIWKGVKTDLGSD